MYLITWSNKAFADNEDNITYVLIKWGIKVALQYENKVIETEELLAKNPNLGQFDQTLGLYKILVVPQIYMFYEIAGNEIWVIRMWNNHKMPYW